MSLFEARIQAMQAERRRTARFTVDCAMRFRMISGHRDGRLANISEQGAKLALQNPPREGMTGWLAFSGHEAFCRVIWSTSDSCGVEFERPLPQSVLIAIAGEQAKLTGPVANAGNIPMGRKRGGRLVSGS
jgi:PilZ domain